MYDDVVLGRIIIVDILLVIIEKILVVRWYEKIIKKNCKTYHIVYHFFK